MSNTKIIISIITLAFLVAFILIIPVAMFGWFGFAFSSLVTIISIGLIVFAIDMNYFS